jgi:ribosomal protein S18 acetylase RimI-like enzyme
LIEEGTVDPIGPDQVDAAARSLAEAFHDDPLLQLLSPDERRRPELGRWFFSKPLAIGLQSGHVWGTDDASAVAVWFPPGRTHITLIQMLRVGMGALPFKAGWRSSARLLQAMSATESFHNAVGGSHWYLMAIGTRASRRGQGLGGQLLDMGTSRADAAGLPCYLETATDANIAFYSKRGFEVIGQRVVHGFTLSGMVRPAR